jgi:hypothetical protein
MLGTTLRRSFFVYLFEILEIKGVFFFFFFFFFFFLGGGYAMKELDIEKIFD